VTDEGPQEGSEEAARFTAEERQYIEAVAHQRGISFDEAATQLAKEGLARRVQKHTGRRPASYIRRPN